MSVQIPLTDGEELIFHDGFAGERQNFPIVFAASREALYVSREKHFAMETWCYERFPIEEVRRVLLKRERPLVLWTVALLIFASGAALAYFEATSEPWRASGTTTIHFLPYIMIVFGAAMPFLAKNRRILIIERVRGGFRWKPKMQFDKNNRQKIEAFQNKIVAVCREVGIDVASD